MKYKVIIWCAFEAGSMDECDNERNFLDIDNQFFYLIFSGWPW